MFYRAIFKGNFQFGNERSFEKVVQMYQHQVESLYKGDVLLKPEQMFQPETLSINLSNIITQGTEKSIKNTAFLLEVLSKFAFSGQVWCWMVADGKAPFSMQLFPSGDKTPVMAYLNGYQLLKSPGCEQEALEKFNQAINKFDRHWTALERRGYTYLLLGNFEAAIADFTKSIAIAPEQSEAFSGLARVYMQQGEWLKASEMLDQAIKNSVPHMSIYWQSRRIKGECLVNLGQFDKAFFELNLCVKRQYSTADSNYAWRKSAMLYLSRTLAAQGKDKEANDMFISAINLEDAIEPIFEGEQKAFYHKMITKNVKNLPAAFIENINIHELV